MKIPKENKEGIAQRVKKLRTEAGKTMEEIASLAKCSYQSIYEIERAGSFSVRLVRDVASALGVTETYLMTGDGPWAGMSAKKEAAAVPPTQPQGNVRIERVTTPWREVPVVSWATAGAAKNYEDLGNYLDERVVTECKDPNAFAVIVDGNSMEPVASAGDRVVVSPNSEAQSGDLVIARTRKEHEVYFKKFLRHGPRGNKVRFVSYNPDYPPLEFDLSDFRFIYPVVNLVRIFRRSENGHAGKR